jgi:predicted porin
MRGSRIHNRPFGDKTMRSRFAHGVLCAAAATTFLPAVAAAQSSVIVYGLIDAIARHTTNAGSGGASVLSDGAYTGSRLGFKGTEDLGGGTSALFSLEMGIDPSLGTNLQSTATAGLGQSATSGARAFGRESLVGLSSSLGTVTLGRQYTIAHQFSSRFQPQANPNDPALSVFSVHHVARQDNMVKAASSFGPVGVVFSVTANEGNGKAWGAGASYTAGPVDVLGYAMDMKTNAAGTDSRKIVGLGGAYAVLPGLKLFVGGMKREQATTAQKNKVFTVGLNYNLTSQWVLTASHTDDSQTGTGVGHRKVGFAGASYYFSKRTDVYFEVDRNQVTGAYPTQAFMATRGSQTGLSLGLRQRF